MFFSNISQSGLLFIVPIKNNVDQKTFGSECSGYVNSVTKKQAARKLAGENLKVARAEFSILS